MGEGRLGGIQNRLGCLRFELANRITVGKFHFKFLQITIKAPNERKGDKREKKGGNSYLRKFRANEREKEDKWQMNLGTFLT